MARLEELTKGAVVSGLFGNRRLRIVDLVEQWQDELWQKFALDFRILTRDMIEAASSGNPFTEQNLLIARLDHLARNDELQARLRATDWDLVIIDEAHKMSARYTGGEIRETKRYRLGQSLRYIRRAFSELASPASGTAAIAMPWRSYFGRGKVPQ